MSLNIIAYSSGSAVRLFTLKGSVPGRGWLTLTTTLKHWILMCYSLMLVKPNQNNVKKTLLIHKSIFLFLFLSYQHETGRSRNVLKQLLIDKFAKAASALSADVMSADALEMRPHPLRSVMNTSWWTYLLWHDWWRHTHAENWRGVSASIRVLFGQMMSKSLFKVSEIKKKKTTTPEDTIWWIV